MIICYWKSFVVSDADLLGLSCNTHETQVIGDNQVNVLKFERSNSLITWRLYPFPRQAQISARKQDPKRPIHRGPEEQAALSHGTGPALHLGARMAERISQLARMGRGGRFYSNSVHVTFYLPWITCPKKGVVWRPAHRSWKN